MGTTVTAFLPFAKALGWSIVHSLWQVMLIALLVRIVFTFTSNRSANFRYTVSILAIVSCFLWFVITFFNNYESQQVANYIGESKYLDLTNKIPFVNDVVSIDIGWLQQVEQTLTAYSPLLAMVWVLGILMLSIRTFQSYYQLQQLVKTDAQPISKEWLVRLNQLRQQMGIAQKVRWLTTQKPIDPMTFYHFKPLILTPIMLFTGLSTAQIEAILLHELAHIKRHDYLFNWLQSVVEVVLFYHPAVWWLSSQIRIEREHCCDDLVLKFHQQPLLYANALTQISVLQFSSHNNLNNHLTMSLNQNKGQLTKRVFRLLGQYEQHNLRAKSAVLAIVLLIGTFSMAFHFPATTMSRENKVSLETPIIVSKEDKTVIPTSEELITTGLDESFSEEEPTISNNTNNEEAVTGKRLTPPDTIDLNKALLVVDGKIIGNAHEVDFDLGKNLNHLKMVKSIEATEKYGDAGRYGAMEITSSKKITTDYDFYISYNGETGEQTIRLNIADSRKVKITVNSHTTKGYNSTLLDADFQGKFEHKWDSNKYPKGVYNITLKLEGQIFTKSIVEER